MDYGFETHAGFTTPLVDEDDYLCLTDIAKFKNALEPNVVVANWLRLHNTTSPPPVGQSGFERQENGTGFSSGSEKSTARFCMEGGHIVSLSFMIDIDRLGVMPL